MRFTDAELAAEYWGQSSRYSTALYESVYQEHVEDNPEPDPEAGSMARFDMGRKMRTFERFATTPSYDE